MKERFLKVKHTIKPVVEEYRVRGETPTRYRYKEEKVEHKGHEERERLGFKGHKVVEVAFIKPKK